MKVAQGVSGSIVPCSNTTYTLPTAPREGEKMKVAQGVSGSIVPCSNTTRSPLLSGRVRR